MLTQLWQAAMLKLAALDRVGSLNALDTGMQERPAIPFLVTKCAACPESRDYV